MNLRKVAAKYVKRSVCDCGDSVFFEDIPLGAIYQLYPDAIETATYHCGACGKEFSVKVILADNESGYPGWVPLGLFELPLEKPS